MSRKRQHVTVALLGAIWLAGAALAAGDEPCANFAQVTPVLYRGAAPTAQCLDHLAMLGVRTVVDLRGDDNDTAREQTSAGARGMRYLNVPMSPFRRPLPDTVQRVLALVGGPGNQPVFVHCKRGGDRTGLIVAAYRMAHDGWSNEQALKEAKRFGLGWWQVRMKGFIRDFPAAAGPQEKREEHP